MIVPSYSAAVAHSVRNSSSVPNAGSTCMLMRSKWPSIEGVSRRPLSPPAMLHRAGVDGVDADPAERVPQPPVGERGQVRLAERVTNESG